MLPTSLIFRKAILAGMAAALAGSPVFAQTALPTPAPLPTIAPIGTPAPLPTLDAFPTPAPLPSMTPLPSPSPVALDMPSTPGVPTPAPSASPSPSPASTPGPSATPLPDGTMPLPLPPMPTPVPLPDAQSLSEQLSLPTPAQMSEPLAPGAETRTLESTEALAMKQQMASADFFKALEALIAKQHNAKVPDMRIEVAIETALKKNPEILDAAQRLSATSGEMISIRSQIIPKLTLSSEYGYTTVQVNTDNFAGAPNVNNQAWNINLVFSQLLYDGGAAVSGIRAALATEAGSYFTLRQVIDKVISDVKINFYEVVLNRALIIANQQSVDLLTEQLKDQQNRYEAGTVPRFNVLQAEVALANAKPPLIQAENSYRISLYKLVRLLGMDYPPGYPSEVPFNIVGKLDYFPRNIKADESIRIAVTRNPGLKAQRQSILSDVAKVNEQVAGYLPNINASAKQTNESNLLSQSLFDMDSGWFFGIEGKWAVWDGLLTYGNVKQAKAKMEQSKINYDNGVREVILQVQQAISNLLEARETVDSQKASVVQGVEALRLSQERLDAGAGTQLDVLNQQVSLLQSQTFLLQAYYNYIKGLAEYDRALSLDTKFQEFFDDPLTQPQAKRFNRLNEPARPQAKLPRSMRKSDPLTPVLEPAPTPAINKKSAKPKPTPKPTPTPKPDKKKKTP